MFYVYVYFNPLKSSNLHKCGFEPFYVGKGTGDRKNHHLFESSLLSDSNKHKSNTIKKILKSNQTPIIEIIQNELSETEAYDLEKYLISLWGRVDLNLGPLTNLTDGGEGAKNLNFDTKYRQKISDGMKRAHKEGRAKVSEQFKNSRLGSKDSIETIEKRVASRGEYVHSTETKEKLKTARWKYINSLNDTSIFATMLGKTHSEESKERISKSLKIKLNSPETKQKRKDANSGGNNPRAKKCSVFGNVYSCLSEMEKQVGINKKSLKKEPTFYFIT